MLLIGYVVVKEITGQKRNRIFEFVKYMDILNEGIWFYQNMG